MTSPLTEEAAFWRIGLLIALNVVPIAHFLWTEVHYNRLWTWAFSFFRNKFFTNNSINYLLKTVAWNEPHRNK
ncbi:MAG TPA: hypothetical protein DEB43_02080 [Desulfovibrio sp.]|nr:hypothetical protein [Desulfovibrio sp.]